MYIRIYVYTSVDIIHINTYTFLRYIYICIYTLAVVPSAIPVSVYVHALID